MKKMLLLFLLITGTTTLVMAGTLTPELIAKINSSPESELIPIMITMETQGDFGWMAVATDGLSKQEARELVIGYLQDIARETQRDAVNFLKSYETDAKVQKL